MNLREKMQLIDKFDRELGEGLWFDPVIFREGELALI